MSFSSQVKRELYPLQRKYFTLRGKTITIEHCGVQGAEPEMEDPLLDEAEEDRRASIRGAFLLGGSVSDPAKSYHFEIVVPTQAEAEDLVGLMRGYQVEGRIHRRGSGCAVYVKESSQIADLLGVMGAHHAVLEFENARILHEMKGNVNRQVNCETANIRRTVDTSVRQVAAIRRIEERIGLQSLPENLQEMARIRLAYPDAPLGQLGEYLHPPVGKSGVNHRLRRIVEMAEAL